jgi:hypothetical protein
MCSCGRAGCGARFSDRFVRETAQRICFLVALAGRFAESDRFLEELRRALGGERSTGR